MGRVSEAVKGMGGAIRSDPRSIAAAIAGGMVAAALLAGASAVAARLGLFTLNFGRLLGTTLLPDGRWARVIGSSLHLLNGGLGALAYHQLFRHTAFVAGPLHGALIGAGHFALATLVLGLAPRLHPRAEDAGLRPMRPFAYGPLTIPAMVAGHVIYGAIVGAFVARSQAEIARARVSPL